MSAPMSAIPTGTQPNDVPPRRRVALPLPGRLAGTPEVRDDLGNLVPLPGPVRSVVSLGPSLTEVIAASAPGLIAGATR